MWWMVFTPPSGGTSRIALAIVALLATSLAVLLIKPIYFRARTVVTHDGLLLVTRPRRPKTLVWKDIWVPSPDDPFDLPPEMVAANEALAHSGQGRLWMFLHRKRSWNWMIATGVVFVRRKVLGIRGLDAVRLHGVVSMPRPDRRRIMRSIHRRWLAAVQEL